MKSRLMAVIGSIVLIGGLAAFTPEADSPVTEPSDSPTWVSFDQWDYDLVNPVQLYIQGTRVDDGCSWTDEVTIGPGSAVMEGREIGIDPSTCLVLMEYGTPPEWAAGSAFADDEGTIESGGGEGIPDSSSASPSERPVQSIAPAAAAVTQHSAAYFKTAWEDPLGIDVNSVQNDTDWRWNGSCVVSPVYGYYHYGWYTPTGWWKVSDNFQNTYNCTQTTVSSYAHFANDDFCPGGGNRTHAYYDRNTVHGRYNGNATKSVNTYVSGGCSGFLHMIWLFCIESPVGTDPRCTTSF